MQKFAHVSRVAALAIVALIPVTSLAVANPAAAAVDMKSECKKNQGTLPKKCQQPGKKPGGLGPAKGSTAPVGDCEAMATNLADVASDIFLYGRSARRWPQLHFAGKSTTEESDRANAHAQQIGAKFTSALAASSYWPNRDLLERAIPWTRPDRSPIVGLSEAFEEIRAVVAANVEAGKC